MSALAVRTGLGQPRPGLPGPRAGPTPSSRRRTTRCAPARNQYPPGHGVPELVDAIARHQQRHYGLDLAPRPGGGDDRGDRGDRRGRARPGGPGRRGGRLRAVLRQLPRDDPVRGRRTSPGDAAGPRLPARPRRAARRRSPPRTTADPAEHPAQPDRAGARRATSSPGWPTSRRAHDLVVVTDEVYEHLTFDDHAHVPVATLPGMAERTVTISSSGKTFSFTGWKIGWATGPPDLVAAVEGAKNWLSYSSGAPFQPAIAHALDHEEGFHRELRDSLRAAATTSATRSTTLGHARCTSRRAPTSSTTDVSSLRPRRRRWRSAPRSPSPRRVVAIPSQVFYEDGLGRGPAPGPVGVLQGAGRARRGDRPASAAPTCAPAESPDRPTSGVPGTSGLCGGGPAGRTTSADGRCGTAAPIVTTQARLDGRPTGKATSAGDERPRPALTTQEPARPVVAAPDEPGQQHRAECPADAASPRATQSIGTRASGLNAGALDGLRPLGGPGAGAELSEATWISEVTAHHEERDREHPGQGAGDLDGDRHAAHRDRPVGVADQPGCGGAPCQGPCAGPCPGPCRLRLGWRLPVPRSCGPATGCPGCRSGRTAGRPGRAPRRTRDWVGGPPTWSRLTPRAGLGGAALDRPTRSPAGPAGPAARRRAAARPWGGSSGRRARSTRVPGGRRTSHGRARSTASRWRPRPWRPRSHR